eukprot:UN10780
MVPLYFNIFFNINFFLKSNNPNKTKTKNNQLLIIFFLSLFFLTNITIRIYMCDICI